MAKENDTSWENTMKHMEKNYTPAEWKRLKGVSNGGYHYLGAAKIMAPIGLQPGRWVMPAQPGR